MKELYELFCLNTKCVIVAPVTLELLNIFTFLAQGILSWNRPNNKNLSTYKEALIQI